MKIDRLNKNLAGACVGLALGLAGFSPAFAGDPGFHCYQDPSDGQTYCQVCSATGDAPLQCGPWTLQPAIESDQILPDGGGPGSGRCDPGLRTVIAPDGTVHTCPIPCAFSSPPSDPVCTGGGMLGGGGGGGDGGFDLLP